MGLFSIFGKSNVLYFPGCITYFKYKEIFELYKKIFIKLGINFIEIEKKVCCGLDALEAGYESEARKLGRRNFEIFKEEGIKSIITTDPACYKMFLQHYPEFLPDWNIEIKNIWEIILDKLESKSRLIKNKAMETVGFHDNCYLGRYCEIYDVPRKILEIIGYEVREMEDSKEESICCGSCGGLPRTNFELADKIARERILQAKRIKVKKLIVCSVDNYALLKKNSGESGIEVLELSEVLATALGIKRKEVEEEEHLDNEEKILSEVKAEKRFEEELKDEDYYDGGRE